MRISTCLSVSLLLALALGLPPTAALADEREVYTLLEAGPSLVALDDPAGGLIRASSPGLNAQLSAYYGLSNAFHLGGFARFVVARDVAFAGVAPRLPDGSAPVGTFYEDAYQFGAGALVAYRLDTGYDFAPVGRLELGAAYLNYARLQHVPTGKDFGLSFPTVGEFAFGGRAVLALEYRISNHLVASVGLGARYNFNALTVWQLDLPLSFGGIF